MRVMKIMFLVLVFVFYSGCASKSVGYSSSKISLNFVNKTDSTIKDVSIYSSKENKKVSFSHIPKDSFNTYSVLNRSNKGNLIILSWKYKNRVYVHEIKPDEEKNLNINRIDLNLFSNGKYTFLIFHTL